MKIVFLADNYSTPDQPGLLRTWALSQHLCEAGHDVTVISPTTHYLFDSSKFGQLRPPSNLRLVQLPASQLSRGSLPSRLRYYLSHLLGGTLRVWRAGRCDVVVASLTPSMLGIGAYLVARMRAAQFVLDERDLAIDAAAQCQLMPRPVLAVAAALEGHLHRRADRVVAATPGLKRMLEQRGIAPERVTLVPNGFVDTMDGAAEPSLSYRLRAGWDGKFVILYAGGLGLMYDLDIVLDALALLPAHIVFAIMGEGEKKASYRARAEREGLRVEFPEAVSKRDVAGVCKAADACLLSLRAIPWSECSLSTKLIDYLGAGRPVIVTGPGDNADLVTRAGAGLVVSTGDAAAMAAAIEALSSDPCGRKAMGESGRTFVTEQWRQDQFSTTFERAVIAATRPSLSSVPGRRSRRRSHESSHRGPPMTGPARSARPLTANDVDEVARLHQRTFAGELGTAMGRRYMRSLVEWFVQDPAALALVIDDGTRVTAYAIGAPAGYGVALNQALRWSIVRAAVTHPWVALHPNFRRQFSERLRLLFAHRTPVAFPPETTRGYRLVGICVDPAFQRRGVGRSMLGAFTRAVFAQQFDTIELSVFRANVKAQRFYEHCGWVDVGGDERVRRYVLTSDAEPR